MVDAKSLLENLVRNAAPQAQPQQQAQVGGLGGLGDILGQVLQGGGKAGNGGLGDILGQLQKNLGQQGGDGGLGGALSELGKKLSPGGTPHANVNPDQETGAGRGGLGDILGQLKDQLGKAGGAVQGGTGGGGIADILNQVLTQATQGVKEGAGRLDSATGASETLGRATGKSPADILAQLQEIVKNNPLAAGAAAGSLGTVVLGTKAGRSLAGSAAKLGSLAMIGGLAYKAFQNYQAGRPLITGATAAEAAPDGSGFEPEAVSNDAAALYIKAMIAAAAADGRLDGAEQSKIMGSLRQAGLDAEAEEFLAETFNNPPSVEELAEAASSPEESVQVYTAARIAIEPDTAAEKTFLAQLAQALGIDNKLAAHIDATARSAAA